jgi:hypothetical protein
MVFKVIIFGQTKFNDISWILRKPANWKSWVGYDRYPNIRDIWEKSYYCNNKNSEDIWVISEWDRVISWKLVMPLSNIYSEVRSVRDHYGRLLLNHYG